MRRYLQDYAFSCADDERLYFSHKDARSRTVKDILTLQMLACYCFQ